MCAILIKNHTNQYQNFHQPQPMSASTSIFDPTIKIGDEQQSSLINNKAYVTPERKKAVQRQQLGDQILYYLKSTFWVGVAIATIYYSNFFHHLFRNPKISPLFFEISMAGYTMIVLLILYTTIFLPLVYGVSNIEQYNPKLIPVGAVVGVIAVISLLIAIWPVWGFASFLIFIAIWKGFFSLSAFLPGGQIGNILFIGINAGTVLSFYIIEHEGYFH